jgi:hypothetical protein
MAQNEVIRGHSRGRLRILCAVAHTAGDYAYEKGWYGWVQDSVAAGKWGVFILDNVVELKNVVPGPPVMSGTKLYAPATAIATTLPLMSGPTTGWNPVGRVIATSVATGVARVRQFADQDY